MPLAGQYLVLNIRFQFSGGGEGHLILTFKHSWQYLTAEELGGQFQLTQMKLQINDYFDNSLTIIPQTTASHLYELNLTDKLTSA